MKSPYMEPQADRLSLDEIGALKIFHNNSVLLKLLRKVFFQMDLTEDDTKVLNTLSEDSKQAIRKVMQPVITWDAPVFMQKSPWLEQTYTDYLRMTLSNEAMVSVKAKQSAIRFMENGLVRLEQGLAKQPLEIDLELKESPNDPMTAKGAVLAHQYAISTLESGLLTIQGYADRASETPEQRAERIRKDSSQ